MEGRWLAGNRQGRAQAQGRQGQNSQLCMSCTWAITPCPWWVQAQGAARAVKATHLPSLRPCLAQKPRTSSRSPAVAAATQTQLAVLQLLGQL